MVSPHSFDTRNLTARDREQLIKDYLPDASAPPGASSSASAATVSRRRRAWSTRRFLIHQVHLVLYIAIHAIFSVWFRLRRAWHAVVYQFFSLMYYHHRTPELIWKDVRALRKMPTHLSVVLDFHESDDDPGLAGLEGLASHVCEIAAWCVCAGIPFLSVYERGGTGV